MTMKRILHCTLIVMVLVASGCAFFSDESPSPPTANPSPSPLPKNEIDFAGAANDIQTALTQLGSSAKPGEASTVKPVKDAIDSAIRKLGPKEERLRERCTDCENETISQAVGVLQTLTTSAANLGQNPRQPLGELEEEFRNKLRDDLNEAKTNLEKLSSAHPKSAQTASARQSVVPAKTNENTGDSWWWDALIMSLQIIGGLIAVFLLLSAVTYLWKYSWRALETNVARIVKAHVAATREVQPDYEPKLSSLASTQTEINSKLTALDTEVRSLARLMRESLATRRSDRSPSYNGLNQSLIEEVSIKDEPEFPVSAVDYLGKMNRFANVVRPDFQNGILVNDPEGSGELVLIRDPRVRDDTQPLFVVPRATQFHTKQDFYTYYQKYYECVRPSAGDVWIIGPAVVEKVAGGWQLREKGMLEIR